MKNPKIAVILSATSLATLASASVWAQPQDAADTNDQDRVAQQTMQTDPDTSPMYDDQDVDVDVNVAPDTEEETYIAPTEQPERRTRRPKLFVSVGGGVAGFAESSARDVTDTGGTWDARLGIDAGYIGGELAYRGTAQGLDMGNLSGDDTTLVGNGAEALVRFNFTKDRMIQPFIYSGVGWTHYTVSDSDVATLANMRDNDDIGQVPAGGGIALNFSNNLMVDVRGDYRATFADDIFDEAGFDDNQGLNSWTTSARLGFRF